MCKGMGDKWSDDSVANVSGAKYPLLWPATLPDEDQVRAAGHLTLSTAEWVTLLASHWRHLVLTTLTRAGDTLGVFKEGHIVYSTFIYFIKLFM